MSDQERIALFIDGANLYASAKSLGFDIDYKRLLKEFQGRGRLIRAFYYTALVEDQEYSSIRPLVDWLDYNGYSVVTKPTKEFVELDRTPQGQRQHGHRARGQRDGDGRRISTRWCCFPATAISVRWSRRCSARACASSVVSTIATQPPMVADELRRQADEFIDLTQLDGAHRPRSGRARGARRRTASRRQATCRRRRQQPVDETGARVSAACDGQRSRWEADGLRRQPARAIARPAAARRVSRRQSRRLSRLVATRRSARSARRRAPADRRPGAGPARRQPHRTAVHRRLRRRPALRDVARVRLRRRASTTAGPTTGSRSSIARSSMRCVACRRRTSRRRRKSPPAGAISPARSARCRGCERSSRSAASPTTAPCARSACGSRDFHSRMARATRSSRTRRRSFDSYHCSRYNTNTGVLTASMFRAVFAAARAHLERRPSTR